MTSTPAAPADIEFAVEVAVAAGDLTLEWFQNNDLTVDHKDDGSPVTAADRAAERLIRERLAERHPDDTIIGEEEAEATGVSGRTWVIDPVDGTKAFTRGVPLFSTLLALVDDEGPAIGVIHLAGLGETVWAGRGRGAFHNGRPCRVNDRARAEDAYVCTSGFSYWAQPQLARVLSSGAKVRTWGDAYGYFLVATGRAEAMIDPECFDWDVAPIGVIISEAGGTFTDRDGKDSWTSGSGVATNGHIHETALAWLAD